MTFNCEYPVVVLWDVTPSILADLSHCLGGTSCPQNVCLCDSLLVLIRRDLTLCGNLNGVVTQTISAMMLQCACCRYLPLCKTDRLPSLYLCVTTTPTVTSTAEDYWSLQCLILHWLLTQQLRVEYFGMCCWTKSDHWKWMQHEGHSKISGTEFGAGKLNNSQVTPQYDPPDCIQWFQRFFNFSTCSVGLFMNGMPVPNCIQLYVCNFLESFPLQGDLHNGKQEEAGGGSGVKDGE